MYYSKIIAEEAAGAGKRRCVIEKPVGDPRYVVKAVFYCGSENRAREFFDYLINLREPKAATPEAPAPRKRGRPKQKQED